MMAWFLMHLMRREKASSTVEADKKKDWDSTITIHTYTINHNHIHIQRVLIFKDQALHNALTSGRSCWLATQSWANSNSRLAADIWCNTSCTLCTERLKIATMSYYFYRLPLLSASSRLPFPSSSVSRSPHPGPNQNRLQGRDAKLIC